jgi:hypothetical protein
MKLINKSVIKENYAWALFLHTWKGERRLVMGLVIFILEALFTKIFLGGSFKNLFDQVLNLKGIWKYAVPAIIIIWLLETLYPIVNIPIFIKAVAFTISQILLLLFFWDNRKNVQMFIIGIGEFLNFLVVAANGFYMPVEVKYLLGDPRLSHFYQEIMDKSDYIHSLVTEDTHLYFLADVIYIPGFLWFSPSIVSIGDIIKVLGTLFLIPKLMLKKSISISNK